MTRGSTPIGRQQATLLKKNSSRLPFHANTGSHYPRSLKVALLIDLSPPIEFCISVARFLNLCKSYTY